MHDFILQIINSTKKGGLEQVRWQHEIDRLYTLFAMYMTYARYPLHDILSCRVFKASVMRILTSFKGLPSSFQLCKLHIRPKCKKVAVAMESFETQWFSSQAMDKVLKPIKNTLIGNRILAIKVNTSNSKC